MQLIDSWNVAVVRIETTAYIWLTCFRTIDSSWTLHILSRNRNLDECIRDYLISALRRDLMLSRAF